MSPTAKTTLKKVYKVAGYGNRCRFSLTPDSYHLLPVLSDKNFHKDKTFTAHKVLVVFIN